jgi:FkbM family methyltransferase
MVNDLIRFALWLQGKGYGKSSIKQEINAVSKFVRGGVLFDIGANKGIYTRGLIEKFSEEISELHIFEPSSELVTNYSFNHELPFNLYINQFALSSSSGSAQLHKAPSLSGLNSLTKRRLDHFDIYMSDSEDINIKTLDEYVQGRKITGIDFLKIDVEGHELDVLKGAEALLSNGLIKCIQFEFGGCNIDTRNYFQDFWYLLTESYKYKIYRITPLWLKKINRYTELDEVFLTTNYLAVK